MSTMQNEVSEKLSGQCRRQVDFHRRKMRWIGWLFVVGSSVSILGLVSLPFSERPFPTGKTALFALAALYFGAGVARWLSWPFPLRPRLVPYFARQLGEYGGQTSAAFSRGRGLYRTIVALDRLASELGVRALSGFGFADDFYEQEVQWHEASEGLRSVEVLRENLDARLSGSPDVADDLSALASVLCVAAEQHVAFSLTLRLHKKDSLQVVSSMESRHGRFW